MSLSTEITAQCPRRILIHRHSASSIYGYALKGNARSPTSTPTSSSTPAPSPQITRPSSFIQTPETSPPLGRSATFDRLAKVTRIIEQFPETPEPSRSQHEDAADNATVVNSPDSSSTSDGASYTTAISRPPKSESSTPRYRPGEKTPVTELGVRATFVSTDLERGFQSRIKRFRQSTSIRILVDVARSSRTNILLFLVPVGIALFYADVDPIASFVCNILAMIPLAGLLTYATHQLSGDFGPTWTGIIDVTLGNAVELIISLIALIKYKQIKLVQYDLLGCILVKALLILGTCFIVGNWTENSHTFDPVFTQTTTASLALAAGSLLLPVTVRFSSMIDESTFLNISRGCCIILLLVYFMYQLLGGSHLTRYLLFLLRTHSEEFVQEETETENGPLVPKWIWPCFLLLNLGLFYICANAMLHSFERMLTWGQSFLSPHFTGLILIPIASTLAEVPHHSFGKANSSISRSGKLLERITCNLSLAQ